VTRADVTSRIEAAERAYQSADRIYQKAREDRRARMTELQTLRAAAAVELDRARVAKWADPAIDAQLAEADETVRLAGSELRRVRHELGVEYAAKVRADNATIRREYGAAKASVIPSLGADDIGSRVVEDPRYLWPRRWSPSLAAVATPCAVSASAVRRCGSTRPPPRPATSAATDRCRRCCSGWA
jgi:hypothetical protein